jgi:hypothetical protein
MTSKSDFFDASDLFNIPEAIDIPDTFCRAGEFSKKFKVSWKILYLHGWMIKSVSMLIFVQNTAE